MRALKWVAVLLTLSIAGFMLFDGVRAFALGDYLTPSSGAYAGQLGPWTHCVEALGIAPRSALMKSIFVAYGASWLVVLAAFVRGSAWSWKAMVGFAVGSLWYLTIGTAHSVVILALLLLPPVRRAYSPKR